MRRTYVLMLLRYFFVSKRWKGARLLPGPTLPQIFPRLIKGESRSEQGRVEEQPEQILDGFVALVDISLLLQLGHDGVLWVNLHDLLGHHADEVCSETLSA